MSYSCFKSTILTHDSIIEHMNWNVWYIISCQCCFCEVNICSAAVYKYSCRIFTIILCTVTYLTSCVITPSINLTNAIEDNTICTVCCRCNRFCTVERFIMMIRITVTCVQQYNCIVLYIRIICVSVCIINCIYTKLTTVLVINLVVTTNSWISVCICYEWTFSGCYTVWCPIFICNNFIIYIWKCRIFNNSFICIIIF